jgi:transposase
VIVPPGGVRVLVATRPVDFRKGMDGLAAVAKETLAMIRAFCSAVQARR